MTSNQSLLTRSRAAVLVLSSLICGCGYPQVSPGTYELAKVIDNLCSYRKPEQIEAARELIRKEHASRAISDSEQTLLMGILDQAQSGDWQGAGQEARELLQAQNRPR